MVARQLCRARLYGPVHAVLAPVDYNKSRTPVGNVIATPTI